jgi:phosphate:Na+ symporter
LGILALQQAVPNLKEHPEAIDFLNNYMDNGFLSIILFVVTGTVITLIVQSSSAAIAFTITLLSSGLLPLELALAMVLGENIGTTITANIAAIIANKQAKQAARVHFLLNLLGALWMLPLLPLFKDGLDAVFHPFLSGLANTTGSQYEKLFLALFHTSFNIANMLVFVGLSNFLIKLSEHLVSRSGSKSDFRLEYIGSAVLNTPELAIFEVYKEVSRFARIPLKMNQLVSKLLDETDPLERSIILDEIKANEVVTDKFDKEITTYLTELTKEEMSPSTSLRVRGLMQASKDLERIGDIFYQVAMNLESKNEKKVYFVPKQRQNLKRMSLLLDEALYTMIENLEESDESVKIDKAREKEQAINALRNELRTKHLKDAEKGRYSLESGLFYSDMFTSMEEIADYIINVSEGLVTK